MNGKRCLHKSDPVKKVIIIHFTSGNILQAEYTPIKNFVYLVC